MKTLKDLALLVEEKEAFLAYGSETFLLGVFVSDYDYLNSIINGDSAFDSNEDCTEAYDVYKCAYEKMEELESKGIEYTVEYLF